MKIIKNLRLLLGAENILISTDKGYGINGNEINLLYLFTMLVRGLREEVEEETLRQVFELAFKSEEKIMEEVMKKITKSIKEEENE